MRDREVARIYARAFFAVHAHAWSVEIADHLDRVGVLIRARSFTSLLLSLEKCEPHRVAGAVEEVLAVRGVPRSMRSLLDLLVFHKRLTLLGKILVWVRLYVLRAHRVEDVTVWSAAVLPSEAAAEIARLLEHMNGTQVRMHVRIDHTLIAGFCIMGEEYIWEYSVRDRLKRIAQLC